MNYAIVWNDEEPQYIKGAMEAFRDRKWKVYDFREPQEALIFLSTDASRDLDFASTVFVVDLMAPFEDDVFTKEATRSGFLTGLHLLKLLKARGVLDRFLGVFIYSVLANGPLRKEVEEWRDGARADGMVNVEFVSKGDVLFAEFPAHVDAVIEQWIGAKASNE